MANTIPLEKRERAKDLYIFEGFSYKKIAELTGISETQLQRWGRKENWKKLRSEEHLRLFEIKHSFLKLKEILVKQAVDEPTPQKVYALASFLRSQQTRATQQDNDSLGDLEFDLKDPAQAIKALEEALYKRIAYLSLKPEAIDPEKLKQIEASLSLITQYKQKYGIKEKEGKKKIDPKDVKEIEERYLGLIR